MRRASTRHTPTWRRGSFIALAVGLAALTGATAATPALASTLTGTSVVDLVPTFAALSTDARDASVTAADTLAAAEFATSEVSTSGLTVDASISATAMASLRAAVDKLKPLDFSPALINPGLVDDVNAAIERVRTQTTTVTTQLTAAEDARDAQLAAEKAAAEAAAAAAQAQAEAEAAAAALAAGNTPEGAKATARTLAAQNYGWGDDQFSCLESLWTKESGWNYEAYNNDGGATGIPQSLPGSKMASAGADWQTNATTQIIWGLGYINGTYGSPCAAWGHSQSYNWY